MDNPNFNRTTLHLQKKHIINITVMNSKKLINALQVLLLGAALVFSGNACNKIEDETSSLTKGTVSGTITDEMGSPLSDVKVVADGAEALSAADGSYYIEVEIKKQTLTFTKDRYATASLLLNEKSFNASNLAEHFDVVMNIAGAVITGKCVDGNNGNVPMAGVVVTLNGAEKVTTGQDGVFTFENLTISDYELLFAAAGYPEVKKNVKSDAFASDLTVSFGDVKLGAADILRGLTLDQVKEKADVWHYNEYRGGKNGDDYPHFDWSSDYMGTLTSFWGSWEEQNEGTTLQIRNDEANGDWSNPADLEVFDSYLFGRKMITADNCKMYVKVRTHGCAENELPFGVQVIDLSKAEPVAELIGEVRYYGSDRYSNPDPEFDLTPYIGKEVVIAVGIFRAQQGDWWKQLVIRRIAFAAEAPSEWGYLPGTPVAGLDEGYKMTMQMVRSTMPVTEFSEFTGISPKAPENIDGPEKYRDAYKTWRPAGHFAAFWSCMPVKKDAEPFAGEGFVIKTNGGGCPASLDAPQAYFYAKFAIKAGHDKLTVNCRNFDETNATYFKVTAITEDGTVKHLAPLDGHGAASLQVVENGAVKMIHTAGSVDTPEEYAHVAFDLSEFNGKNVVVALAVLKGEQNDQENKLSVHSITIK